MSNKSKFIKEGKSSFKDETYCVAGEKVAGTRRGGKPQSTDEGVSRKTGYEVCSEPAYRPAPGSSIHGT